MNRRRLIASLLVGVAVGWGMWLAPLQWPRTTLAAPPNGGQSALVFFAPDGRHVVTVHFVRGNAPGNHGTAVLWDTSGGRRIARLTDGERLVNSIAFSPDGSKIATRQEEGTIRLWDRATGELLEIVADHREKDAHPNTQIVYAPDGRLLFEVGRNWTLMRYVDTGEVAFDFRHELRGLSGGTINHQGYYLAAGGNQAVVVRLDTGERIARFVSTDNGMDTNGALSPDGRSYATTFWPSANQILVWCGETGTTLPAQPWLNSAWNVQHRLAIANDANLLAVHATYNPRKWIFFGEVLREERHRLHLLDPKSGQEVGRIEGGQRSVFSSDGRTLAVTMGNGDVQLWDVPLRKPWGWIALAAVGSSALTLLLLYGRTRRRIVDQGTETEVAPTR